MKVQAPAPRKPSPEELARRREQQIRDLLVGSWSLNDQKGNLVTVLRPDGRSLPPGRLPAASCSSPISSHQVARGFMVEVFYPPGSPGRPTATCWATAFMAAFSPSVKTRWSPVTIPASS